MGQTVQYAIIALLTCTSFAQTLPDSASASKKKTADTQFWALTAINTTATLADAITTAKLLSHTPNCPREVWGETLYGVRANDGEVFALMAAKAGAATLASYFLKRHNIHVWKFKLWTLPLAYNAYGHTWGAAHNMAACR